MEELAKYLRAIVLMQSQQLQAASPGIRVELLLAKAGLGHKEIADMVGKSQAAVAKAISRAKASEKQTEGEPE